MKKQIIPIFILLFLWSCSSKTSNITKINERSHQFEEIEIVEEARVDEEFNTSPVKVSYSLAKEISKPAPIKIFKEKKVLKHISSTVPRSCLSWSDGCNTCEKVKKNRASCTVYTCQEKTLFSCLVWQ